MSIEFPESKKFGICLTHDVDRIDKKWWHCLYYFVKTKNIYHLKTLYKRRKFNPYWNFERIMALEDKYGVRSTFFFLNEQYKFPKLNDLRWFPMFMGGYDIHEVSHIIRRLDEGGWEVAVHGSFYSYLNKDLMLKEKLELERIVGHKVIGIRQHNLNLKVPDTWKIQKEVGFKYDASFGSNYTIGFRDNKTLPFRPFGDDFIVIPLTIMDSALFRISKNLRDAWSKILNILNYAEKKGALVTVLWHQRVFNENEFPGWSKLYEGIIQEGIKRKAWIATCRDVYEVFK